MSYITSITKEILQVTYEDISEDEIFNRVSEIIAREIIGSQMDRQYTIDAEKYLDYKKKSDFLISMGYTTSYNDDNWVPVKGNTMHGTKTDELYDEVKRLVKPNI
jgi:hypothetical protein